MVTTPAPADSVAPKRRRHLTERARAERRLAAWLVAPAAIVMLAVTAYPIIDAIILSLQRADLRFPSANKWVGPLERQDDRVDDRIGRDGEHHDRGGSDQPRGQAPLGSCALGQVTSPLWRDGVGRGRGCDGAGAHSSADEDSEALISLRNVLTTVLGLMFEVGDRAF